jgi:integrase
MPDNLYRRGAIWWARVQSDGREYRRSLRTASKVQARQRLTKILEEVKHQRFHGEARHSWKMAVLKWGEELLPGKALGTAKRYLCSLEQIAPFVAELYVDEINRKVVAKVAGRKGASNATRRRDLSALSSVLRSCVGWGWIDNNPARDYDRSIIPELRPDIYLPTDAEVAALVARCSPGLGRLVQFLDKTGCREDEGASLEHPQLSLERQEATFQRVKRHRVRTIRLRNPACPEGVGTELGTVRHLTSPQVFYHGDGERYRNVASQLAGHIGALVAAGKVKRFRVHDLRHRFAVRWLKAGGDIYALSRHLGHTSVKTTEVYLRYLAQDSENESAQKAAQVQRFGGEK